MLFGRAIFRRGVEGSFAVRLVFVIRRDKVNDKSFLGTCFTHAYMASDILSLRLVGNNTARVGLQMCTKELIVDCVFVEVDLRFRAFEKLSLGGYRLRLACLGQSCLIYY